MEIRKISRRRLPSVDDAELGHITLSFCRGRQRNVRVVVCLSSLSLAVTYGKFDCTRISLRLLRAGTYREYRCRRKRLSVGDSDLLSFKKSLTQWSQGLYGGCYLLLMLFIKGDRENVFIVIGWEQAILSLTCNLHNCNAGAFEIFSVL